MPKLVIVGSGFGGLGLAFKLREQDIILILAQNVTLLPRFIHTVSPRTQLGTLNGPSNRKF